MVRGKVELKRIEDTSKRTVSFSKRREGIFKKAEELSVLCEADVALIIYSSQGKLYEYSNKGMEEILAKYTGAPESTEPTTNENGPLEVETIMLRRLRRHLNKRRLKGLSSTDWQSFEQLLTEVSSAVKKQQNQDHMEKFEELRLKDEKNMEEKEKLREELEELKRSMATKNACGDPETSSHLGMPADTSEKITTPKEKTDAETPMIIE